MQASRLFVCSTRNRLLQLQFSSLPVARNPNEIRVHWRVRRRNWRYSYSLRVEHLCGLQDAHWVVRLDHVFMSSEDSDSSQTISDAAAQTKSTEFAKWTAERDAVLWQTAESVGLWTRGSFSMKIVRFGLVYLQCFLPSIAPRILSIFPFSIVPQQP